MQQQSLWFESWEEAAGHDINALGGRKKVARLLWPAEAEETAYDRLKACLARGHNQAFKPSEVLALKRLAHEQVGHSALCDYEARELGQTYQWIDAESELTLLLRSNSDDYKRIEQRQKRLEALFERHGARMGGKK